MMGEISPQDALAWPAPENGLSLAQLASWMNAVAEGRWNCAANSRCKYVTLRIDTRRGAFRIEDRDGHQIDGAALRWQYSKDSPLRPPALATHPLPSSETPNV